MTYETILTEELDTGALRTGLIRLNRPKQLNALNDQLMNELGDALTKFDLDEAIGAMVITGSEKAFAAGADIAMMQPYGFVDAYTKGLISRNWETIRQVRKPVIAAVAGFALGGGCELVMMCDVAIAADTAKFGQPEIKLGIIPGAGGTQRLPRAISKAKAMDMVLTARMMDADEAERSGLVSRVVPAAALMETARGRRCVPPAPGMMPSLISGWPNLAVSAAIIMSHIIATSQPPPSAKPATAAMTGLRTWRIVSQLREMWPFMNASM